jgi:hypothetical protein
VSARRLASAVLLAFAAWAGVSLLPSGAQACACCTDVGQRHVAMDKLDGYKRDEIARLRFAATATLFTGNAEPGDIKGLRAATSSYDLEVDRTDGGIAFTFRDDGRRSGTLSLSWPELISIFEVDPRQDRQPGGLGPRLYKEWRVTGRMAGTGIFVPGNGDSTRITLILHGGGNSCTSAEDFTAWTLRVDGPDAAYAFIGDLEAPR